jgi:gamma-glutamylputrescine oxidase
VTSLTVAYSKCRTPKTHEALESQKKPGSCYGHTQLELMDAKRIQEVGHRYICRRHVRGYERRPYPPVKLSAMEAAAVESIGWRIRTIAGHLYRTRAPIPLCTPPQRPDRLSLEVVAGNAYLGNLIPELSVADAGTCDHHRAAVR